MHTHIIFKRFCRGHFRVPAKFCRLNGFPNSLEKRNLFFSYSACSYSGKRLIERNLSDHFGVQKRSIKLEHLQRLDDELNVPKKWSHQL